MGKIIYKILYILTFFVFIGYSCYESIGNAYLQEQVKGLCPEFYFQKHYLPLTFKGKIIKKYRDSNKHYFPQLDIYNNGQALTIEMVPNPVSDTPFDIRFWQQVEEGDSIFKEKNATKVFLKKKHGSMDFDVTCK